VASGLKPRIPRIFFVGVLRDALLGRAVQHPGKLIARCSSRPLRFLKRSRDG
jgi:hypothetical protein